MTRDDLIRHLEVQNEINQMLPGSTLRIVLAYNGFIINNEYGGYVL